MTETLLAERPQEELLFARHEPREVRTVDVLAGGRARARACQRASSGSRCPPTRSTTSPRSSRRSGAIPPTSSS